MIKSQIIADSINPSGNRLTTMIVTFPRIILAEVNTHRAFSRNSASSRAIPFKKMVESVQKNPFIPMAWQKDHKGMQGSEYFIEPVEIKLLETKWLKARDRAIESALDLAAGTFDINEVFEFNTEGDLITLQNVVGVTKQLCNRLLEPFMWHTVIVSSTEFENFFSLRCPKYVAMEVPHEDTFRSKKDWIKAHNGHFDVSNWTELDWLQLNKGQAEIHMMALAESMYDAYQESTPKLLLPGDWHIPFGDKFDIDEVTKVIDQSEESLNFLPIKIATARCARVSYTVVGEEGKPHDYNNDVKLHDNLLNSRHSSPMEHCAVAMEDNSRYANFKGWKQYRTILEEQGKL